MDCRKTSEMLNKIKYGLVKLVAIFPCNKEVCFCILSAEGNNKNYEKMNNNQTVAAFFITFSIQKRVSMKGDHIMSIYLQTWMILILESPMATSYYYILFYANINLANLLFKIILI